MNNFEFISYVATPDEKHLGIAIVKAYGKMILCFKVVPNKEGGSYFVASPSVKLKDVDTNQDYYKECILIDSRSEHDDLISMIKRNVKKYIESEKKSSVASAPF